MILGVEPVVSYGYHPPSRLLLSGVPLLALPEIDGLSHRRRKKTGALGGNLARSGGDIRRTAIEESLESSKRDGFVKTRGAGDDGLYPGGPGFSRANGV